MCECGCSNREITLVKFKGPSKNFYTMVIHPGCEECEICPSLRVSLYKNKKDYEEKEGLGNFNDIPDLDFEDNGYGEEFTTELINLDVFTEKLIKRFDGINVDIDGDKFSFKECVLDCGIDLHETVVDTVMETLNNSKP